MVGELLVLVPVVLALICALHWMCGDRRRARRPADYGLLVEIATVPSRTAARIVTERLDEAGIRSTAAPAAHAEALGVLVFRSEAAHARSALLDAPWPRQQR